MARSRATRTTYRRRLTRDYDNPVDVVRDIYGEANQSNYNRLRNANPGVTRYTRGMTVNAARRAGRSQRRRSMRQQRIEPVVNEAPPARGTLPAYTPPP